MTFPNRPEHHDFTRLSAVIIEADDQSKTDGLEMTLAPLIDLDSATYMGDGRAKLVARHNGINALAPRTRAMMVALWLDGLRAGIRFEQEGGKS